MDIFMAIGPNGQPAKPDMSIRLTPDCFIWFVPVDNATITVKVVQAVGDTPKTISEVNLGVGVMNSYVEAFTLISQLIMAREESKGHA